MINKQFTTYMYKPFIFNCDRFYITRILKDDFSKLRQSNIALLPAHIICKMQCCTINYDASTDNFDSCAFKTRIRVIQIIPCSFFIINLKTTVLFTNKTKNNRHFFTPLIISICTFKKLSLYSIVF